MISYRKLWPADRLARFDRIRAAGRKKRLTVSVTNIGPFAAPRYMIRIKLAGQVFIHDTYSLDDAEKWVEGYSS